MVKVLRNKTRREIASNWRQYLAIILIALLAVTLFTGLLANYENFKARLSNLYESSNAYDFCITTSSYDPSDEEFLKANDIEYNKRIYLTGESEEVSVNVIVPASGNSISLPIDIGDYEFNDNDCYVDANFLERKGLKSGDTFKLSVLGLPELSLKITGSMTHPEALDNSKYSNSLLYVGSNALAASILEVLPSQSAVLFIDSMDTLYNQYIVLSDDIDKDISIVKDYYNEKATNNLLYCLKLSDMPSNITIEADANQAKKLLYIFPVIFYLVAILIILTSISQLIVRERTNIGIMTSLGLKRGEILFHYSQITVLLCLIGSIVGMIIGPLIIPNVMNQKYNILYQMPSYSGGYFRFEYLISVLLIIGIAILSTFLAARRELIKTPSVILRGENSFNMKKTLFEKIPLFKKTSLSIKMAFRNMKRRISRTVMVVIGVIGCSALLVCAFGIIDTLNYGIYQELDTQVIYDVSVGYTNNGSMSDTISSNPLVSKVNEYGKYSIILGNDTMINSYIYIIDSDNSSFMESINNDEVILSKKVASEIGVKENDTVSFTYLNTTYQYKITRIVDFCLSQGIFINSNNISFDYSPNNAWILCKNQASMETLATELREVNGISSAISYDEMKVNINDTLSSIKIMTNTIKVFAVLLALVVLYNLALLNYKERTRDIATLKVLGFNRIEIGTSLTLEVLFLTIIGSIIGLFFGYPLLYAVLKINETPLLSYIYHINPFSYVITVVITCGTSIITNLFLAMMTNKVQMVESLKSVE